MVYAQILNSKVRNVIVLDDVGLESTFSQGFDALVRIDDLSPGPQIGWDYVDGVFSNPTPPPVDDDPPPEDNP